MNNTLMLGNGFNRVVFSNAPDWKSLYNDQKRLSLSNYTLLYEACLLENNQSDNQYKRLIADKLRNATRVSNINRNINDIEIIGKLLEEHNMELKSKKYLNYLI